MRSAPSSLRSRPRVRASRSALGRRTFAGRVAFAKAFDVAVPVERTQRRQPAGDGGAHPPVGFHLPTEELQLSAADLE